MKIPYTRPRCKIPSDEEGNRKRRALRIALAYDHRGSNRIKTVIDVIQQLGHEYIDLGSKKESVVDSPEVAYVAANAVKQNEADTAILLCNTGMAMCVSANKVKGIRATLCYDELTAYQARFHLDANVLCLSAELFGINLLRQIIAVWLDTEYAGSKRAKRVIRKIEAIEEGLDPRQVIIDESKNTRIA